jgi:hypothetical protein
MEPEVFIIANLLNFVEKSGEIRRGYAVHVGYETCFMELTTLVRHVVDKGDDRLPQTCVLVSRCLCWICTLQSIPCEFVVVRQSVGSGRQPHRRRPDGPFPDPQLELWRSETPFAYLPV